MPPSNVNGRYKLMTIYQTQPWRQKAGQSVLTEHQKEVLCQKQRHPPQQLVSVSRGSLKGWPLIEFRTAQTSVDTESTQWQLEHCGEPISTLFTCFYELLGKSVIRKLKKASKFQSFFPDPRFLHSQGHRKTLRVIQKFVSQIHIQQTKIKIKSTAG